MTSSEDVHALVHGVLPLCTPGSMLRLSVKASSDRIPGIAVRGAALIVCLLVIGCAATPRFGERSQGGRGTTQRTDNETPAREAEPVRTATGKVLLTLQGVVSYYANDFHGKETSNGETFDMNDLTAAHRTVPFGTKVRVTNLDNNKSVIVRVNDRGPFVEGRIMDLSLAAAKQIDLMKSGTTEARLEVLQWGDGK